MNISFDDGELFITRLTDTPILFADNLIGTADIEMSASENPLATISASQISELSFDMSYCDLNLINEASCFDVSQCSTIEWYKSIMIQARWHKNARIRKKWLNRYGMKPDRVKCTMKVDSIEMVPGNINYNYADSDGIMCNYTNYELTTKDMPCYHLKPHQKRRDIKIEWNV